MLRFNFYCDNFLDGPHTCCMEEHDNGIYIELEDVKPLIDFVTALSKGNGVLAVRAKKILGEVMKDV